MFGFAANREDIASGVGGPLGNESWIYAKLPWIYGSGEARVKLGVALKSSAPG